MDMKHYGNLELDHASIATEVKVVERIKEQDRKNKVRIRKRRIPKKSYGMEK